MSRTVNLVVIGDIICPWCYIGEKEMENAVEAVRDLPITIKIEHRPYQLQPSLPEDQALVKREWYINRFGKEKFQSIMQMITLRGQQLGLNIKYDGTITQTVRAHRLSLKALKVGGQQMQQTFLQAINKAYFEENRNIGDSDVLSDLAQAAGIMAKDEAVNFLESDDCREEVVNMMSEARKKGVTGVPFTIIDGRWAVIGGQTAEVYIQIFKKLAQTEKVVPICDVQSGPVCSDP
ncbi:thioredoxin-like protein [Fomitopsis serialis]|uniref:thioredoxin-like protein n=1 Tax=Fomitopsis serialis TaxID=139415 RepID=UPI0020086BD1|nr:thioredoxin-like protein [Neoantrodia serialis]KAH9930029.1 thioredoxin-like protein [Neoantrodia serialis]